MLKFAERLHGALLPEAHEPGRRPRDSSQCSRAMVGTEYALRGGVKAKNLEDLVVYREANEAAVAVSAVLGRPAFGKDFDLKDQLSRSSSRVGPLIAEGFGQLTDKHVATYLARARGSAFETRVHLSRALNSKIIADTECADLQGRYEVIGKRLTRWIGYLHRANWKYRG